MVDVLDDLATEDLVRVLSSTGSGQDRGISVAPSSDDSFGIVGVGVYEVEHLGMWRGY